MTITEAEALATIKAHLAKRAKARVKFYRQFYNGVKCIPVSPKTADGVLRLDPVTGRLQLWEGKSAGGWIDVLGRYRVIAC